MNRVEYEQYRSEYREKCRELENTATEDSVNFKYDARLLWWEFIEKTQRYPTDAVMSFREFWDCESTYPQTIAA